MSWLIEGRSEAGEWSWQSVAGTRRDATYETELAAEEAVSNLVATTGWDADSIRVVEVG